MHELTNAVNNKHQVSNISWTIWLAAVCVVATMQWSGMDTSWASKSVYHPPEYLGCHTFIMQPHLCEVSPFNIVPWKL